MGIDYYIITEVLKVYGPALEKLYTEDINKFKGLFREAEKSLKAGLQLNGGKPTQELMNRKLSLDAMAAVNAKMRTLKYFAESKDDIPAFLRGEEDKDKA